MIALTINEIENNKKIDTIQVLKKMIEERLPDIFIFDALRYSIQYEGIYELIQMWYQESNIDEKNEIIADIQDLIDDCQVTEKKVISIDFNDLDEINKNLREFKNSLLLLINKKGGLKVLSEKTGIPQPSLSRLFNSSSVPQRTTLLKIKTFLGVDKIEIDSLAI